MNTTTSAFILALMSDSLKRRVLFKFDETGSKMLQRMYLTDTFHVETHHLYGGDIPASRKAEAKPKASGKPYTVRVVVNDDTQTNPVHSKAEIWFRA